MCTQKNLNLLRLNYYNLKSLKLLYLVPLAVMFLLLPFFSVGHVRMYGADGSAFYRTFMEMQRYIPFLATWWIMFGLREYAEGGGKEILHVYKKSLVPDFFVIFFWYILHMAVLFTLYGIFLENYWLDFLLMLIQGFVFAASTFFLMIVCKTIAIPFLLSILYEIFCIYTNMSALRCINMLSADRIGQIGDLLLPYLPLALTALLLVFGGNFIYRKRGSF